MSYCTQKRALPDAVRARYLNGRYPPLVFGLSGSLRGIPSHRAEQILFASHEESLYQKGLFPLLWLYYTAPVCPKFVESLKEVLTFFLHAQKRRMQRIRLFQLAKLFLLCARSLRFLAALDARAFIMLTLAELGKRTRFGARTLETAQRAVNRLVFFNADLRHSFPSLRAFPYGGTLCTAYAKHTKP